MKTTVRETIRQAQAMVASTNQTHFVYILNLGGAAGVGVAISTSIPSQPQGYYRVGCCGSLLYTTSREAAIARQRVLDDIAAEAQIDALCAANPYA